MRKNLKNTSGSDLYKLFFNDKYFNKVDFLSKIIYKQDLEILSELLTDLYYQKINISLDELNLNFDIIKIKNSFFDYDSIFNNIIDYKIHIIDVLNTLVDKDKIDKDSTFNLFYNFFVVNIVKILS